MKPHPLLLVPLFLLAVALGALGRDAVAGPSEPSSLQLSAGSPACSCPSPTYARFTSSATVTGQTFVELDTDAGPLTLTLPPAPAELRRLEVWLGQGGTPATIDPNGHGVQGPVDLVLDQDHETLELLFVVPIAGSPGYWRVRPK